MTNLKMPVTPAEALRRARAEHVAYTTGVVLRIVWDVAKPILGWALFIAVVGVWFTFSLIVKVLLGSK